MKLNGMFGTGTGRLGSSVFSSVAGQQVVRQYQPNVANPNTSAQIDQRAKLKLMSQVAAAMSSVIAIPREGLVSSRNKFIKKNFSETTASEGVASINVENLQLTAGNMAIGGIEIRRQTNPATNNVNLVDAQSADVARVVYISFAKNDNEQLQLLDSVVVSEPGADRTFPGMITLSDTECVVYAYGIKDKDSDASAKYANYKVESASDVARLVANRSASSVALALTATTGGTILAGENEGATSIPLRAEKGEWVRKTGDFHRVTDDRYEINAPQSIVGGRFLQLSVSLNGAPQEGYTYKYELYIGNALDAKNVLGSINGANGSFDAILTAEQAAKIKNYGLWVVFIATTNPGD